MLRAFLQQLPLIEVPSPLVDDVAALLQAKSKVSQVATASGRSPIFNDQLPRVSMCGLDAMVDVEQTVANLEPDALNVKKDTILSRRSRLLVQPVSSESEQKSSNSEGISEGNSFTPFGLIENLCFSENHTKVLASTTLPLFFSVDRLAWGF